MKKDLLVHVLALRLFSGRNAGTLVRWFVHRNFPVARNYDALIVSWWVARVRSYTRVGHIVLLFVVDG